MLDGHETIQWLRDRAEISDVLFAFARALDSKDWQGYADLFAEDGHLLLPWGDKIPKGQVAAGASGGLGRYEHTHHLSANHQIEISGDTAVTHSYVQALHVPAENPRSDHWLVLGWYDNKLRRENGAWKFTEVALTSVWENREVAGPPR
ncbi:nuclear transport factor 2 family protein [Streptomyces hokutonensis]|uniref:nuclear transport factor 2 family protein n=1 Tax=Streptomyces hokutonensis TaxID=1306990 RepID=UPI0037FF429A